MILQRLVPPRAVRRVVAVVLVGLLGAGVAVLVAGIVDKPVGPVDARFGVHWSWQGGTRIGVAPLGSIRFADHDGPIQLSVRVTNLRVEAARRMLADPKGLDTLGTTVRDDVISAVEALAVRASLVALGGAVVLSTLVFRRWRPVAAATGVAVLAVAASGGIAALTFNSRQLYEPRYSGLLVDAPAVVGDMRNLAERFKSYEAQLGSIVGSVSRLYDVTSALPAYRPSNQTIRVLHVSDLHDDPRGIELIRRLVGQFKISAVADTGDVADHGTEVENRYTEFIRGLGVPYLYIKGNHDSAETVAGMKEHGATVLNFGTATIAGLRFYGAPDPRFTPDKRRDDESMTAKELLAQGRQALQLMQLAEPPPVDVVLAHDPEFASAFLGQAPYVLAGHLHRRKVIQKEGTLLLVEGSTGGAGLRTLDSGKPTPLECQILYFDRATKQLQAYDEVTVGGLGLASVKIERHIIRPDDAAGSASPSPSPP